jgi:hypothetical protein
VIFKEQAGETVYDLYANTSTGVPDTSVYIGGEDELRGPSGLPLNTWTHLAATYDGTALRLYENGTQVATVAQTGAITTSTGALRIGGNNIWSEWFAGQIDDVRIYDHALTASDIQADMNRAVG